MKRQFRIILFTGFLSAMLWSCSKNSGTFDSTSLKSTFNQSALELNNAMDAITSSSAYSILTVNDGTFKSADSIYKVYIPLDKIKGVYDYKPVPKFDRWGMSLIQYFNRTDDNDQMIVRMPLKKVKSPRSLRQYNPKDSVLTNNFQIAVSDYHNNYNNYHDFDYLLASEISIDNVIAGNLNIDYFISPSEGIRYASQYSFSGSYTAKYKYESGDTTVSSFTIMGGDKVLYEEKLLTERIDTGSFGHERQYILTIGDVQIIRKSGQEKVEVLLNGILQPNAVVEIIDKEEDSEASVCKKRDIQITFEDGTTTTISELIGNSVANIRTLFYSLHQVYFAAYVVDWIAYDIYYQRN
jgi:hypothetical protein